MSKVSKTHVVTLRMPLSLKQRLEREAKYQGISLNQLTNYLLTMQVTQLERESFLESRLAERSLPELKKQVQTILEKVPERPVPEWDSKSE